MLKKQTNFLVILLLSFVFIFMSYAVIPYLKKPLPKITGTIVKGTGQTSLYGYPTANMKINKKLCHIHNFNSDILGETLTISKVRFKEPFPENEY